ncbi:capsular exopolysaccharide family [Anaerocolumna xylanovorans DSM 12503]|uniref:non-specific protein-tyrosine kinase n=2 Tax=Anaerocolumna TaxID=1843210 RepID=A0A1M7Y1S2_9FIRM|nr:capsular exopolysaccharide family [Anaerocolumna xylanovorans DSM 12503]
MEFTVRDILYLIKKRFILIAACTFAGLLLSFLYTRYFVDKTYTASSQFYVSTIESTSANLSELDYAQKIAETYINFLNTRQFYSQVLELSGLPYSVTDLRNMTEIKAIQNTEIFSITLTSNNPNDSYRLVKSMEMIVPKLIEKIKTNSMIYVVDPVVCPTSPSGPNILLNTLLGGIVCGFLAFFLFVLKEILNLKVINQEDLLKHYDTPLLGCIPDFSPVNSSRKNKILLELKGILIKGENFMKPEKIQNRQNSFLVAESYKTLRTNLRFSIRKEGCKKILITSPSPEDGKSTISINLSIAIAHAGYKVLLIDCDLRKGRIHHHFKGKSQPGLSDFLSNINSLKECLYITPYDNLHIMPMGSIPPNPSELLGSRQMELLIKELEAEYDYIILDTPPINIVADSLSFIKSTDGAILVVRENKTTYTDIDNALMKYRYARANILGVVLNGISERDLGGYKSKYYYYNPDNK